MTQYLSVKLKRIPKYLIEENIFWQFWMFLASDFCKGGDSAKNFGRKKRRLTIFRTLVKNCAFCYVRIWTTNENVKYNFLNIMRWNIFHKKLWGFMHSKNLPSNFWSLLETPKQNKTTLITRTNFKRKNHIFTKFDTILKNRKIFIFFDFDE